MREYNKGAGRGRREPDRRGLDPGVVIQPPSLTVDTKAKVCYTKGVGMEIMIDVEAREFTGLCSSRGPRIGSEDSSPRCRMPIGHEGLTHRPAPEDGWGNITWSDFGWV